jgi:hypothetical protein
MAHILRTKVFSMSEKPQKEPQQVIMAAETISRYLKSNLNSFDSLEGIVNWWIMRQRIEESTAMVKAAMDYLVSKGEVEKIDTSGKVFYASTDRDNFDNPV